MPLPNNDGFFRWQYTLIDDDIFDDGRVPRPVVFAGQHWPIPQLTWADPPNPSFPGRGCWWYPQDLAAAPVANGLAAIRVAARLGAIPFVSRQVLASAPEVHLLREVEVRIPRLTDARTDSTPPMAVAKNALIALLDGDNASLVERIIAFKRAMDVVSGQVADDDSLRLNLGVAEFPYTDTPGARSKRRRHPVAIFDSADLASVTSVAIGEST